MCTKYINILYSMIFGGSLKSNEIFKKILSIGFEFETSELMKFSLHPTKKILINTDTSIKILNEKINDGDAKIIDEHYISHVLTKLSKEELEKMDEDELDYYKNFHYDESETFKEYFFENLKKNDKNNVQFQITNDYSQNVFVDDIFKECENLSIDKNKMYYLKFTKNTKSNSSNITSSERKSSLITTIYDLNFLSDDTQCNNFSCVEYVITYYNPLISNNIIINQFIDACKRINYHIDDLIETDNVKLYIAENDDMENYVNIKNNLYLFSKPNTNLYYLTTKSINLDDITFTPQMTFRSNAMDTVDILKQIIKNEVSYKNHKEIYDNFNLIYKYFENISDIANNMLSGVSININDDIGKILHCYIFLILYKLNIFIINKEYIISGEDYLKDFLIFLSRHSNKSLYDRVKEIVIEKYDEKKFNKLFYQTNILKQIYYLKNTNTKNKSVYENNISDKTHPNYGNPSISLMSYFEHIDNNEKDWLSLSNYDNFSNVFNLVNDEVLLENRRFHKEIAMYLKYNVDSRFNVYNGSNEISIFEMKQLININNKNEYINDTLPVVVPSCSSKNKELICVDKCKTGYVRNSTRRCVKQKASTKAPRKTCKFKKLPEKKIKKCKNTEELINDKCLKKCSNGKIRNTKTNRCIKQIHN
jgi:hypothetical protein